MSSCKQYHTPHDGSWWEYDGYGIPLVRVCDQCQEEKLSRYRRDIKERYDTDDTIEED